MKDYSDLIDTDSDVFKRIKKVADKAPDYIDKQVEKEFSEEM
jgi:hypothetical protein